MVADGALHAVLCVGVFHTNLLNSASEYGATFAVGDSGRHTERKQSRVI